MLKEEDPRYDFEEVEPETLSQIRRRRKTKGPALPVGSRILQSAASFPLQSYLQERFSHIGRKDRRFVQLRAENQRLHDLAASRGNWQMSRTS
jgi:hypothetical protein